MELSRLRVLLVDDHTLFREGLCRLLVDERDFELVGCVESGCEGFDLALSHRPNIVLIADRLADASGIELCRRIVDSCAEIRVIILGECDYDSDPLGAVRAGAAGFLLKCSHSSEICDAIRLVCRGQAVVDLRLMAGAIDRLARTETAPHTGIGVPHARELQVLRLAASGKTNKGIADELGISERTVQSHFSNLFRRLDVTSRAEAVFQAMKTGLVSPSDAG